MNQDSSPSPSKPEPPSGDDPAVPAAPTRQVGEAAAPDSLPVYLDDDAVESMAGKTLAGGAEADADVDIKAGDRERFSDGAASPTAASSTSRRQAAASSGFNYLKALIIFLFVQFIVVVALAFLFRGPILQAYQKAVDRGFIQPGSLPWERPSAAVPGGSDAVGDVAWEDVRRRYELTLLADAAIAQGDRDALKDLRGLLDVADDPVLRAAARSEVFRVQQMYASANRLPDAALPVAQIYPGAADESALSEEQIIHLLADRDREVEWRIRAAYLLEGHRTLSANDALMVAVRKDPHLDVVKQAMLSFKANTGYPGGDLFDAEGAEAWWAENASRLAEEFQSKGDSAAVAPGAEPAAATRPDASEDAGAGSDAAGETAAPVRGNLRPIPDDAAIPAPSGDNR